MTYEISDRDSDLKIKTVFFVYGLTLEGHVLLGTFDDSVEAYNFAANNLGGVVFPGTAVRHTHSKGKEN